MDWEATVRKVNNGYVCTTCTDEDEDLIRSLTEDVFESSMDDDGDVAAFITMVWHLAEYYGVLGSKHDAKRFWCGFVDQDRKPIDE